MRHLERSAKSLTPVRSGYMRAHWEWERRSAGTALGYSLGNSADYATYRMLGVSAKRVTGKAMPVGRTQVVGNPWPASGRITWARYRKGYPGKDIIHLAMAKTAVARRLV